MPIKNITISSTGLSGVVPRVVYIDTTDTTAQVVAPGYLNLAVQNGTVFTEADMCLVATRPTPNSTAVTVGWLEVSHTGSNWSLVASNGPGGVVLPTIANHLAVFTNTTGMLGEDAATAINGGNIQAGLSGTAGAVASFPPAASNGQLSLAAVNAGGAFNTTISNGTMGQSTVYTIPDSTTATAGIMVSTSNLRSKAVFGTATVGGGAGTITITDAFCTTGSIIFGSWVTSANLASVQKITPGNGSFTVVSSADAGIGTFSYIIMKG